MNQKLYNNRWLVSGCHGSIYLWARGKNLSYKIAEAETAVKQYVYARDFSDYRWFESPNGTLASGDPAKSRCVRSTCGFLVSIGTNPKPAINTTCLEMINRSISLFVPSTRVSYPLPFAIVTGLYLIRRHRHLLVSKVVLVGLATVAVQPVHQIPVFISLWQTSRHQIFNAPKGHRIHVPKSMTCQVSRWEGMYFIREGIAHGRGVRVFRPMWLLCGKPCKDCLSCLFVQTKLSS